MKIKSNLTQAQIHAYNAGLKMSQWQITKAMLAVDFTELMSQEVKNLLGFIYNEIEKEKK